MNKKYLKPKLFDILKGYNSKQFGNDLVAGIVVSIIALPLSIALALASGVAPVCGVYTAMIAGFLVSLLGGSRVQIAGPTAAFATIVAGIVAKSGMQGLFLATIMAGILLVIMGVCKIGTYIKYVPKTITIGFTGGIAVTILLGQIKDFLGITYPKGTHAVETIEKVEANIKNISTISPAAILIGVLSLVILILYPKFEKKIPASLIAVIVCSVIVKLIQPMGNDVFTIGELYDVPTGLPKPVLSSLNFGLSDVVDQIPNAFMIAILAAIESLLSCVVADEMIHSRHKPNAELMAQGVANIGSVLFGGIPATGAIARTAANVNNGGRTPIAGMIHAVFLAYMLLFFMPLVKMIPMPTIAAILFIVAYNMSEWRKFVKIVKTKKWTDITVLFLTFALTVIFDLVVAICVGIAVVLLFTLIEKIKSKKEA